MTPVILSAIGITLPALLTLFAASWKLASTIARLDATSARFDATHDRAALVPDLVRRQERVETTLGEHAIALAEIRAPYRSSHHAE